MATIRDLSSAEALNILVGGVGVKRLAAGTHVAGAGSHTDVKEFRIVYNATGSNVVFGTGCVAAIGDAPANTDVVAPGANLPCCLTTIVVSSGVAFAVYV